MKHYILLFNSRVLYHRIFIVHSQRKESGIHIHSKRVYAATWSMFEITSIHSNARTWMYERVHTEPRWQIWTVAYYLSQPICDFLHTLSYEVK